MKRVAVIGTFDVSNFGDLLFPLAAQHALQELHGDVEVVAYSYRRMAPENWFYEVRSLQQLALDLADYDGIIVGGGLIVRGDTGITAGYVPTDSLEHHPLSLWLLPTLMAKSAGVGVAWNAPGVLAGIPPSLGPLVDLALTAADYVSVRDTTSAARLQDLAPHAQIRVVPDSIFTIPSLLADESSPAFRELAVDLGLHEPYVVVQPSSHAETVPHHLAPIVQAAHDHGCRVIELPIGPVNGDRVGRAPLDSDGAVRQWPHPLVVAEIIANAHAVIGDSLHLSVVASAFGVPVYRPRRQAGKHSEALNGLQRVYEWNPEVEPEPAGTWSDFSPRPPGQDVRERQAQVHAHWKEIVDALFTRARPDDGTGRVRTALPTRAAASFSQLQQSLAGDLARAATDLSEAEAQRAADAASHQQLVEQLRRAHEEQLSAAQEAAHGASEEHAARLAALQQEIDSLDSRLATARAEADEAEAGRVRAERQTRQALDELEHLRGSIGMRVVGRYQRTLDKLAPPGSTARSRYLSIMHGAAARAGLRTAVEPETVAAPRRLPTSAAPDVSVVVPVHGKWDYTARCLAALALDLPRHAYEVIVVDDASPDDSVRHLAEVAGVRTIALAENVGFLRACNAGIAAARGRHVVLLNNDTEPCAGWLDALVDTADADPSIGIVGAKLVYGDGTLQEAGGIIWQDGDGWNYGRGDDPDDPRYAFVRDVDYCSGAVLLVRRELLKAVGGFDERYTPAYYEDTDLCFRAREQGFRVVYQPQSVVVHHEGVSHGRDVASGVKRYQQVNRQTFLERWATALRDQHPHDERLVHLARSRTTRGRVLVIDHHVPTYDRDSGSVRMWALLRILRGEGFAVTFVPENKARMEPYATALMQEGIEVLYGHLDLDERLGQLAPGTVLAVLSRARVAADHLDLLRRCMPDVPVVYDTVDLHHLREQRRAALEGDASLEAAAQRSRQQELGLVARTEATIVVAEYERQAILEAMPSAQVHVVGNVHDVRADVPGPTGRSGLLFVGSFRHDPNVDAVTWFVREVLPLVREGDPNLVLTVVGGDAGPEVLDLEGPGVRVLGWVEDLEPHYAAARVVVAPLRYGAGVKGKVGEAMANGVPVVTTTVGAEGMDLVPGRDVLVADSPAGLAAAIRSLLYDDQQWDALASAGRIAVRRSGVEAARASLAQVVSAVGAAASFPR